MSEIPRWTTLSEAALSAWAKTPDDYRRDPSAWDGSWMRLAQHMADSAAVAGRLWDEWLPAHVKGWSARQLGLSDAQSRVLLRFLCGAHDIGKCTPGFAAQVEELFQGMQAAGLDLPASFMSKPHAHLGQVIMERWLRERWGDAVPGRRARRLAQALGSVSGAHHGRPPTALAMTRMKDNQLLDLGGTPWQAAQDELLNGLADDLGVRDVFSALAATDGDVNRLQPVMMLWTGVCIVADWMASDQSRFGLGDPRDSEVRSREAWDDLALQAGWSGLWPVDEATLTEHLGLSADAELRPVQQAAITAASEMPGPGLMVIEAPMGVGKTEAALAAAEIMARRFGFGGVFFGLPTMATSNAMFSRVRRWVEHLGGGTMTLAHGMAALNDEYADMLREASVASVYDDLDDSGRVSPKEEAIAAAVAHSWLSGSKKGLLANFCVGTIDQFLTAALQRKHVMLRQLAMANKVVIVDEVHAADDYMRRYLGRALHWMAVYEVPVILLTATLPPSQHHELVESYRKGLREKPSASVEPVRAYPRISVLADDHDRSIAVDSSGRRTCVQVSVMPDDAASLVDRLEQELRDGGCAGIVCNTVARAQSLAADLRERFGDEVVLMHSRFTAPDRARLEQRLLVALGPQGDRPHRLVVVATQVIEQSLDIDFDLLITDLAPVDLMLQRMGRLHRHDRARPSALAEAQCWVRGVEDWGAVAPSPVRGTQLVYRPHRPLMAAAALGLNSSDAQREVVLPDMIPQLVQVAYAEAPPNDVPDAWQEALEATVKQEGEHRLEQLAKAGTHLLTAPGQKPGLTSLIDLEDTADDRIAPSVRDTEDSLEVLAARRVDGVVTLLDAPSVEVSTDTVPASWVAKRLSASRLRLPRWLSSNAVLAQLEENFESTWQESGWLTGELVLFFDVQGRAELGDRALTYESFWGLRDEPTRTLGTPS